MSLYGFERIRCQNPYDIIDAKNFEILSIDGFSEAKVAQHDGTSNPESFQISTDGLSNRLNAVTMEELEGMISIDSESGKKALENKDNGEISSSDEKGMLELDPQI